MDFVTAKRFKEKISIINFENPYEWDLKYASANPEDYPLCNLWSIGRYLVYKTSYYTQRDFDAFKSLEAYKQFACGWARDIFVKIINEKHVVVGKVSFNLCKYIVIVYFKEDVTYFVLYCVLC